MIIEGEIDMICVSCKKDKEHGQVIQDYNKLEFMCDECVQTYRKFGCDY